MADETTSAAQTVAAAAEAIDTAAREKAVEMAAPVVAAAVEAATERVQAAEHAAQQITDAAMATEMGRMVAAIRMDFETWKTQAQNQAAEMSNRLSQLAAELTPLREQMAAATAAASATISSLTPEKSEPEPGTKVVTEKVTPDGGVVQEVVETAQPAKRHHWI